MFAHVHHAIPEQTARLSEMSVPQTHAETAAHATMAVTATHTHVLALQASPVLTAQFRTHALTTSARMEPRLRLSATHVSACARHATPELSANRMEMLVLSTHA